MLIQEHVALGVITFTHTHPGKHNYTAASAEYRVHCIDQYKERNTFYMSIS